MLSLLSERDVDLRRVLPFMRKRVNEEPGAPVRPSGLMRGIAKSSFMKHKFSSFSVFGGSAMKGYRGKIALVDLGEERIDTIPFQPEWAVQYIGGSGLGTFLLMRYGYPGMEPLGPDNPLIFMNGPFQATGIPTSGRHQVLSRSPLTGTIGEADVGGTFGFRLSQAGFDGIVLLGQSFRPVTLVLDDEKLVLEDADELWGKDTFETERILRLRFGDNSGVACIGPAGERHVSLAAILHDGKHARAAGRGGLGAVMGSKKLKAVVARGRVRPEMYDPQALRELVIRKNAELREKKAPLTCFGTAGGTAGAEQSGDLPIRNWRQGTWVPQVDGITGQTMADSILTSNYGCMACPIRCGREVRFDEVDGAGPEYETVAMLGSMCLVDDIRIVARANDLCNRLGLDTISTGSTIAFAMELFEKGLIDEVRTGCSLNWGDGDAVLEMIRQMGQAEGFGGVLGQGSRRAAEIIGGGAERYAVHVKGLELPAHDPRCYKGLACGYATSSRGACHLSGYSYAFERSVTFPDLGYEEVVDRHADEGKGRLNADMQNLMGVLDSLKICKFSLGVISLADIGEWVRCVTGREITGEGLMETGERIFTMKRLFNLAHGFSRSDDVLPARILEEARPDGGAEGFLPDLDLQLEEYFRYRGWGRLGIPASVQLKRLGLDGLSEWLLRGERSL